MRRLALFALLAMALPAVPASAIADDGGVPAGFGGGDSGGTPAGWHLSGSDAGEASDELSALAGEDRAERTDTTEPTTGPSGGGRAAPTLDSITASAAQEPTPEPQGPGTQQPPDPGAEPPPVEVPTTPVAQTPAPLAGTGGGLPVTGVEVLQLALLGIALVLVGARLRVLALRRRRGATPPGRYRRQVEYDHDFDGPITARRAAEPGMRPSTPTARRREAGRPASRT